MANIAFPNNYSEGTFYQFNQGIGEPRFWRYNSTSSSWRSVASYIKTYSRVGTLAPNTGTYQFITPSDITITNITAIATTGPVGGNINIVIKKDDASAANLTLTPSYTTNSVNFYSNYASLQLVTGDYLTIDLAATTATYYGNNLSIAFRYVYT